MDEDDIKKTRKMKLYMAYTQHIVYMVFIKRKPKHIYKFSSFKRMWLSIQDGTIRLYAKQSD